MQTTAANLHVEAWFDCWAFFDLIAFHGGTRNFEACHYDFVLVMSAPQLFQAGRLTHALAKRWAKIVELPEDTLIVDGKVVKPPQNRLLQMPRGHFKAQALSSKVLTPNGWTTVGELRVGDTITSGNDGQATTVTHLHPVSPMQLYRVYTKDGRSTLANAEHLWQVHVPSNYRDNKAVIVNTKRLAELCDVDRYDKRDGKWHSESRVYIEPVAVEHPQRWYLVSPYTLGLWLGDGTSANGSITSADPEVFSYCDRKFHEQKAKYRYNAYGLQVELRDVGVLNDKHIPAEYLLGSVAQRLELLRGLMDSDGTAIKQQSGNASFSNKNRRLIDDVTALVRSLGGIATECEFQIAGETYYSLYIKLPAGMCPFNLKRKADIWQPAKSLRCYVTAVEAESVELGRCITVDGAMYVTDDYLPTHNSSLVIGYIMWRIYRNPNIRILHASNVRELSEAFIRELRNYFEDGELQANVWNNRPHISGSLVPSLDKSNRRFYGDDNEADDRKVVWSNQQLQMLRTVKCKEPTVLSTSVKAKATGQHYDIVIMDDIVDFDNSSTPTKLRSVKRWAGDIASIRTKVVYAMGCGVMPTAAGDVRLVEQLGDEYVVTGTHYDPGDYYAFIKEKRESLGFAVLNRNIYRNSTDPSEGYLWSKFTPAMECELKAELSDLPGVFEAQYLNLVNNPALQVITTDFIQWVSVDELLANRGQQGIAYRTADNALDHFEPIIAVDFAVSLSSRADYTAICVGGKTFLRRLACADFSVGHFTVEHTLDEIVRLVQLWGVRRMYIETIGFQALYRDMIIKRLAAERISCGVLDYKPVGNKHKRIEAQLATYFSQGEVVFSSRLRNQAIVMNTFSFFGRSSAKDDPPDALAVVAEHSYPPDEKAGRYNKRTTSDVTQTATNMRFGGIY